MLINSSSDRAQHAYIANCLPVYEIDKIIQSLLRTAVDKRFRECSPSFVYRLATITIWSSFKIYAGEAHEDRNESSQHTELCVLRKSSTSRFLSLLTTHSSTDYRFARALTPYSRPAGSRLTSPDSQRRLRNLELLHQPTPLDE